MLLYPSSSETLELKHEFDPHNLEDVSSVNSLVLFQDDNTPERLEGAPVSLRRSSTNVLEISRIISALRDDREQDNVEFENYRNRPVPEEALVEQGTEISKQVSEISRQAGHFENEEEVEEPEDNDHPLDGKFAFWQASLVMLMGFSTWGANAAFGVFLNFYMTHDSFPGATEYDFALIGGMVVFLAQILAPVVVTAVRTFGLTVVNVTGVVLQTIAYFLAAQCTQLWQIYLCQGFMVGFSFSLVFLPGTLVIPTWFEKRKATAMGIGLAGSGLGGVVFSLLVNKMIEMTGDQKWALRTVGIITLATSLFGTVFMRPRNGKKVNYKVTLTKEFVKLNAKLIVEIRVFDNYPMLVVTLWLGVALVGYVIVLYSFSAYATSVGLSHTQASNLLAVMNVAQMLGRPLIGFIGDRCGRITTAAAFCIYMAALILGFWTNATSYGALIVLALMIGGPAGLGSTMAQPLASDILGDQGRPEKLPAAWSGLMIITAFFALPAEVIALKLRRPSAGAKAYLHSQIFTGCCFLFCFFLLLVNREYLVRKKFESRRQQAEDALSRLKNTYLRRDARSDERDILECRIAHYNRVLGAKYTLVRVFYPIRV